MTTPPPCCAEAEEPPCAQHRQAAKVLRHNGIRLHAGRGHSFVGEPGKAAPAKPRGALMSDHLDRACAALVALTAAGEDLAEGRGHDDLIDMAGDDLAALVAEGPEALSALLFLLDTAVAYAAGMTGESRSHTARRIADIAQQAAREDH